MKLTKPERPFLLALQEETYQLQNGPAHQAVRAHGTSTLEIGIITTAAGLWYEQDPQRSYEWPWSSEEAMRARIAESRRSLDRLRSASRQESIRTSLMGKLTPPTMDLTPDERQFTRKWVRESWRLWADPAPALKLLKEHDCNPVRVGHLACVLSCVFGEDTWTISQDESLDNTNPSWPWSSKDEFDQRCDEAAAIVDAYYEQKSRTNP
jgi:hypothetical protein